VAACLGAGADGGGVLGGNGGAVVSGRRTLSFNLHGLVASVTGVAGVNVVAAIGPIGHQTILSFSPREARDFANGLYEMAEHADNVLPTGLGESAVEVAS